MRFLLSRRRLVLSGLASVAGLTSAALLAACGGASGPTTSASSAAATAAATSASVAAPTTGSSAPTPATSASSSATASASQAATTSASASSQSAPTSTASAAPAGKGVTIELLYVSDPGEKVEHVTWMQRYHELHPDVTIDGSLLPEDQAFYDKITAMAAGGTPPDLSYVHPAFLAGFAAKGLLVPIEPFVARDTTANMADFYQTTLEYYHYKGKYYGLPYYSGPSVTYFNKTLFQKLSLKTPDAYDQEGNWTWQTMLEVAQKLTQTSDPNAKTYGYGGTSSSLHWMNIAIWGNGGEVWDEPMSTMLLDHPEAADAVQFQADLSAKYKVVGGDFVKGTQGISYGIRGDVPAYKDVHFDLGLAGIPQGVKGRFCRNGPNAFPIYQASKHQEESWGYANWITQTEAQGIGFTLKRSVPSRQSIAQSGAFEQSLYPWESAAIYRDASDKVRGFPLPSTYGDINSAFGAAYKQAAAGTITALDAIKAAMPAMDAALAKKA